MRGLQKILVLIFAVFAVTILVTAGTAIAQEKLFQQEVVRLTAEDGRPVPALMTFPKDGMNVNGPAVIHCQGGPGSTPLGGSGPWIAEGLASRGYTVVAPMVRHADRLFTSNFDDMALDVKAAVDFLAGLGFRDIILTGSSFGSITTTRYLVKTQDPRIKANIHFAPTADMNRSVPSRVGNEAYWKAVAEAGRLVSAGKGMETVVAVSFTHAAQIWLELWGPASTGVNSLLFPQIKQPILLLLGDIDARTPIRSKENSLRLKANATSSSKVDFFFYEGGVNHSFYPVHRQVIEDVAKWLEGIGLGPKPRVKTEVVTINEGAMGEGMRRGLRYSPASGAKQNGPAFIFLHDWTDDAFKGPSQWLGPALAQAGYTAMSIDAIRGQSEILRSKFEMSDDIIKDWIDYLEQQGFSSVVLEGHGFGSLRASHYVAGTQDKRVRGVAYLAPARDAANWTREGLGADQYNKAVAEAEDAVRRGDGDSHLIQFKFFMPPPAPKGQIPFHIVMMANPFLSTWGPQAPTVHTEQIRRVGVPVLLLAGSNDTFVTEEFMKDLARAAKAAIEFIWYGGGNGADHIFTGYEARVTKDIINWVQKIK